MNRDEILKAQGRRLAAAREAAGFDSARAAAAEMGWATSSYGAHEGGRRTIGHDDAEKYARAFRAKGARVNAQMILFGSDRERADEEWRQLQAAQVDLSILRDMAVKHGVPEADLPPIRRFARPSYGGVVEAGAFRPVEDFDDDPERYVPPEEVDRDFPDVPIISFDVAGDSMNALSPTPIHPGQRVIALDYPKLRRRVPLRDGMVVIVEQTRDGGHLRERSVKQLLMHRDRTEFCPRSTNPRHKPIVVPFEMRLDEDDDGREVRIIALVRRVVTDLPGWG